MEGEWSHSSTHSQPWRRMEAPGLVWTVMEERKYLTSVGFELRTAQPVANPVFRQVNDALSGKWTPSFRWATLPSSSGQAVHCRRTAEPKQTTQYPRTLESSARVRSLETPWLVVVDTVALDRPPTAGCHCQHLPSTLRNLHVCLSPP